MDDSSVPTVPSNWNAKALFDEACSAADATHETDLNHKEAVARALCLTLKLVEEWRGEHRAEITAYLGDKAPGEGADDVLPFVKHVFARQDKRQWTWHANALRQAIAEGKTADDAMGYFKTTPPTKAAKKWSSEHPKERTNKPQYEEIEIDGCAGALTNRPEVGGTKTVELITREGGKLVLRVRKPAGPKPKKTKGKLQTNPNSEQQPAAA